MVIISFQHINLNVHQLQINGKKQTKDFNK